MTVLLGRELLSHWTSVRDGLIATIVKFDDAELAYQPFPGGYSVAKLMLHIADEEDIEVSWGLIRRLDEMPSARDPGAFVNIGAIVVELGLVRAKTIEYAQALSDTDLLAEVEMAWGQPWRRIDMLWHVMEHEVHHRAELSLILGLLGREGLDA